MRFLRGICYIFFLHLLIIESIGQSPYYIYIQNDGKKIILKNGNLYKEDTLCIGSPNILSFDVYSSLRIIILTENGEVCFVDNTCTIIDKCIKLDHFKIYTPIYVIASADNSYYVLNQEDCSLYYIDRWNKAQKEFYLPPYACQNIRLIKNYQKKFFFLIGDSLFVYDIGNFTKILDTLSISFFDLDYPYLYIISEKKIIIYDYKNKKIKKVFPSLTKLLALRKIGDRIVSTNGKMNIVIKEK